MINVLFAAPNEHWERYETVLNTAFKTCGLSVRLATDVPPEEVDYIIYAPSSWLQDFTPYTRCKAVLNLWAGVENVVQNPTLKIPLARMVDHGMTQGMVEWVTGHVLRHHLGMDRHITASPGWWEPHVPPLAQERAVTVLGFGALGRACAEALGQLGFNVSAWSNSRKTAPNIRLFHGRDQLANALMNAEILVLLLPLTNGTRGVINAQTLAHLPKGAVVINAARGPLIEDDALLQALKTGQISHATLDVFHQEPLPEEHPFWHQSNVTITPHIASATRPQSAAQVIAQNILGVENGKPLQHAVNFERGY